MEDESSVLVRRSWEREAVLRRLSMYLFVENAGESIRTHGDQIDVS